MKAFSITLGILSLMLLIVGTIDFSSDALIYSLILGFAAFIFFPRNKKKGNIKPFRNNMTWIKEDKSNK